MKKTITTFILLVLCLVYIQAQTVTIDATTNGRRQVIDGFGTCLAYTQGEQTWFQNLYYDDAKFSILRMDLVPRFVSPYSDFSYNSPWFHNNPPLPGPDNNNVRTYTSASDYSRLFNGKNTPMAIMGPNIAQNILLFNFNQDVPRVAGAMAQAGESRKTQLGDFKLIASIWSPAPWLKIASGNTNQGNSYPLPVPGTAYPFIWFDNFTGGKLDVSNTPRAEFFDGVQNTSALTQFARSTAAYVKGFQDANNVRFYAISIQNELNFETFYNSCTYPLSSQYITALEVIRAEFDKYPDLINIKIMGPEDLLGGDAYGMWQYGKPSANSVDPVVHKNLQYLTQIAADTAATNAIDFYCIHGYASDGVSSAGANSTLWNWWVNGWTTSPAAGIPANVHGFKYYNKKSWMTETSGENPAWIWPSTGFPNNGAFSIALKIHQALTTGEESAWLHWQLTDGSNVADQTLTDATQLATAAKYNSYKHFSRYIRPNAVRLNSAIANGANINVSSYIHDANKSLTVVIINSNSTSRTITVNVPTLPFTITSFNAYTSSNNNYWINSTANVSNNTFSITVPGYGVCTLYGIDSTATSITENKNDLLIDVFPNPAKNSVTVTSNLKLQSCILYTVNGAIVFSTNKINETAYTINTQGITPGIYFVKATDAENNISIKKLVIER